jgi:hypothetical protein
MADAAAPEITGNVLFYNTPEPLNNEAHAKLGLINLAKPFGFAKTGHIVPVTLGEMGLASMSYPIIFAGNNYTPLAVMGLKAGQNLFVTEDGGFEEGYYLPAYIRRYPFVLAGDDEQKQLIVCIDRSSALLGENTDTPLFDANGATEYTKNAIKFCQDFEEERVRTEVWIDMLKGLDIFENKQAAFNPILPDGTTGEPVLIAEYFAISEDKVNALPDEKLLELQKNGALGFIYAHLLSLLNWDRMIALAAKRGGDAMPVGVPADLVRPANA